MLFLTWVLWRSLRYPLHRYPVYRLIQRTPLKGGSAIWRYGILLAVVLIGTFFFPAIFGVTAIGLSVIVPFGFILFSGTVLGFYWVGQISQQIGKSRSTHLFDLTSLSPLGALGVCWLMASACVHRRRTLEQMYRVVMWVVRLTVMLLCLVLLGLAYAYIMTTKPAFQQAQINISLDVISLLLIIIALWLDHIQSILVAVSVAFITPQWLPHDPLPWLSPILYMVIQAILYLLIGIIYLTVNAIITDLFPIRMNFNLTLLFVIFSAYLLREGLLSLCWRIIFRLYNVTPHDFDMVMSTFSRSYQINNR